MKKKKDKISETSDYRDLEVDSQYNPGQKCGIKNCEHSRKLYSLKEAKHTKQEVEISYWILAKKKGFSQIYLYKHRKT